MELRISKDNGLVRIEIWDKEGEYIGSFHVSNITDATVIYTPSDRYGLDFRIETIIGEVKPQNHNR